jgi:ABC-type dipeptide/oligopeptide/nickel transport system ATPase component
MYQKIGSQHWQRYVTNENSTSATLSGLEPETTYLVKVCGECDIGHTQESDTSDHIKTEKSPDDRLAILFKGLSTHIGSEKGCHEIYKLPLYDMLSKTKGIAKCTIGNPRNLTLEFPEKVLMLVGATGSGKSTLINGIANYVLGVRWEDDFRFKLITEEASTDQTKSVTKTITSYSFPRFDGSPLDFRLTVVDTPGFGDTRGLERDEEITALIKDFFSTRGPEGIDHIDGIGFVAQSPLVRLTHIQKYIIDSILAVFGKDIADNIFLMTTFADGAYPPVVDAIKTHITESDPPVPINTEHLLYFKFNNSALFTKPNDTGKTTFDEMYWNVGCTSLDDFFSHLLTAKEQTLQLTRAVLDERQKLQALIQGIQQDVRKGMNAIDEMRQEKQVLEANEAKIQANKDFTYETDEYHQKKVPLSSGTYVTNCLFCHRTCHFPCMIPKDSDKKGCAAMDSNGYCEVCPNHCFWNPHHVNNDFRYEEEKVTVTKHYTDLEKKYKDAKEGKATAHSMILKIRGRVKNTFKKVCEDISKAKRCLERLEEIALKPNPLTEVEYIDILIKSETDEAKPGWEKRVKCLENARKMAEIMADARKGEIAKHMNLEAMMDDLLKDVPVRPVQKSVTTLGWWSTAKTTAKSLFKL